MRFVTINPSAHLIEFIESVSVDAAVRHAGLSKDVDHGIIDRSIAVVVHEFSMFADPDQQSYFAMGGRLYAGNALLYAYAASGETTDMPDVRLEPTFLHGREEVEAAIQNRIVARPEMKVNGEVIWRWPEPAPFSQPEQST